MPANLPVAVRRTRSHDRPCARRARPRRARSRRARRTYGDSRPGAPRFAGTSCRRARRRCPVAPGRARRRLARQGERQRALLDAEGVPLAGGARRPALARLPARCGSSVRSTLRPRRAAFISSPARCSARCPSWASCGRPAAPAHPAHVGLADAQRERLARRAARLRDLVRRRRPRGLPVGPTRSRAPTTCPRTSRRR